MGAGTAAARAAGSGVRGRAGGGRRGAGPGRKFHIGSLILGQRGRPGGSARPARQTPPSGRASAPSLGPAPTWPRTNSAANLVEARRALREERAAGAREGILVCAFSPPCQKPWSRQAREERGPRLRP